MSQFNIDTYNKYKKSIEDINKKLINYEDKVNRPLPTDAQEKLQRINAYKTELANAYNNYITYIGAYINKFDYKTQADFGRTIGNIKLRILRALKALDLSLQLPKNYELIDVNLIDSTEIVFNESLNSEIFVRSAELLNNATLITDADGAVGGKTLTSNTDNQNTDLLTNTNDRINTNEEINTDEQFNTNDIAPNEEQTQSTVNKMAMTRKEFLRLAASMLNKYDGNPLQLNGFIDSVELLKEMVEDDDKDVFTKLVKSRLEGIAREAINDEPANVDEIISDLKSNIKIDSSKVIEGRMLALRTDKTNLVKFSERAEELAEDFRRSLLIEGFSKAKAKELSIEKTVELCRKNARNDTVKAVIAATKFESPKEVISKMIVEINNLKQDRPSTSYNNRNKNNKFDNRNKNNYHRNNYNNNNNNNNRNNNNDRGNHNNSNNNNNNG
ncbi:myb-like protein W, partial [Contarinia nasturtii]|uniref:myb-like protein W n=1 Tax=Contarinia nasturtii TaxID=265458 RepID=UPI0012D3F837